MLNRKYVNLILVISVSLLASCGYLQEKKTSNYLQVPVPAYDETSAVDLRDIKDKLYAQYNKWRGVRYRLGGLSRHGIDCSGFVHVTFKSKLGIYLPRTTYLQSKLGTEIRKNELKAGDLVFFRTGLTSKHVGIYLEKNRFLHASRSKGVIISRLNNTYWKSNYWKSIRI